MIVAIQDTGRSFKGLHAYLSHDKRSDEEAQLGVANKSKERLDYQATHNLCTNDTNFGWRLMAATAMDQDRLKQQAGVRLTGQKTVPVLHIVVSWDGKHDIAENGYSEVFQGVLKALGAEGHQAQAYGHTDTKNTHMHIMVNRVNPETGRTLDDSNDYVKAQNWALDYCLEKGLKACPNREINATIRDDYRKQIAKAKKIKDPEKKLLAVEAAQAMLGDLLGNKRKSRAEYEAANDIEQLAERRPETAKQFERSYKEKASELSRRSGAIQRKHKRDWERLSERHKDRKSAIYDKWRSVKSDSAKKIRKSARPEKAVLLDEYKRKMRREYQREKSTMGRLYNAFKAMRMGGVLLGPEEKRVLTEPVSMLFDGHQRIETLKRLHKRKMNAFDSEVDRRVKDMFYKADEIRRDELKANLDLYHDERKTIGARQRSIKAHIEDRWRSLAHERKQIVRKFMPKKAMKHATKGRGRGRGRFRERE